MSEKRYATIYYGGFAFRGGGAFMHAQVLRKELQRAGWIVELVTLESLPLLVRFLPHVLCRIVNRFNPPLGFFVKDRLTRFLYMRLFNREVQLRVFEDVYLAWNSAVPSITLIHAVWSDNLQSISVDSAAVKRLLKLEESVIDAIIHPIVTVSDSYLHYLALSHSRSRRITSVSVIPLGLDLTEFNFAAQLQHSTKSLVFCGSLESRKNLRLLLCVFRRLYEIDVRYRLTIIGDGPDRADLESYTLQHELPVVFSGRLSKTDVIRKLREHSLYVHPSVKESFSFALLEAKLTGLKTVAYKGLEVPSEFIDVPVASFELDDWLAALISADQAAPQKLDVERYSAHKMMLKTLEVAFAAGKEES
jgi:glycosyltransferase involved in cell wall biosynthesis